MLAATVDGADLHLTGWQVVVVIGELMVFGWILTKAIIITSRMPPPSMVTTALAVLTLIAMGGLVITRDEILGTLAATGLGALAGAVTAIFRDRHSDDADEERPRQNDDDGATIRETDKRDTDHDL